ncbi:putative Hedgehog signaling attenuator pxb [Aphomia sociella]
MAERYIRSPTEASPYAFWTYKNVWPKNSFSPKLRKITALNINSPKTKDEQDVNKDANNSGTPLHTSEDIDTPSVIATEVNKDINDQINNEDEEVRKNVWSDVDDDIYIAEIIKLRTTDEVRRDIRDTSDFSDNSAKVVSSDKLDYNDMWELEPTDLTECDCLGPPPEFLLPPPPRPPFLQADYYCGDDPIPDLETCDTEPKIDAYNHSGPSLQTSAVIALCSIVLVLGIFVGAILVWKHKRKVTNLLPSKSSAPNQGTGSQRRAPPPAPLYEDLQDLPRRPPLPHIPDLEPQLEMVETKRPNCPGRVFVCGSGGTWRGGNTCGEDTCGAPLYEELPHRSDDSLHSDDHFAEDELSLVGEAAPCRTCSRPPAPHSLPYRPRQQRLDRRPKSLERRRAQHRVPRHIHPPDPSEFHEGVLLDALLRFYPQVGTIGARPPGPMPIGVGGAWPGGELPGIGCWRGPRASPKPPSGDSSFGSDSGYSNNTCGTCGTRASSRHRLSAEIPLS